MLIQRVQELRLSCRGALLGGIIVTLEGRRDDGRPTQTGGRSAAQAKLKITWDRMVRGSGPWADKPNAKEMATLMQLADFSTTDFGKQADGFWRVAVTYFTEYHGKTPNFRFRIRWRGTQTVPKFDNVIGKVVAGGPDETTWREE